MWLECYYSGTIMNLSLAGNVSIFGPPGKCSAVVGASQAEDVLAPQETLRRGGLYTSHIEPPVP